MPYYEFHSLKIAFEHIWQETFDKGLIDHADKWYDQVLACGGNPVKIFQPLGGVMPTPGAKALLQLQSTYPQDELTEFVLKAELAPAPTPPVIKSTASPATSDAASAIAPTASPIKPNPKRNRYASTEIIPTLIY